jgi:hypothetical protein
MPRERPEQTYFPSAKLRLSIRFEEFGDPTKIPATPQKLSQNIYGLTRYADSSSLQKVTGPNGQQRFDLVPKDPSIAARAALGKGVTPPQKASNDGLTFDLTVIPNEIDWGVNGLRIADTLTAVIRFIDAPFDPRCIRACGVEMYFGTVPAKDFAAGIENGARFTEFGHESLALVPDAYVDSNGKQRTNLRFKGFVDVWDVGLEPHGATIRLECIDNTRLLLDTPVSPGAVIDKNLPIDQAVAKFLANYPAFAGMSVEYRPAGVTIPTFKAINGDTATMHLLGPQVNKGAGTDASHSVLDYLADVCASFAHAFYIDGTTCVIQNVQTLTTRNGIARRADDPFQGRTLPTGTSFDYRRFIYGRNLESLKLRRNYARRKVENIELRCFDAHNATKKALIARFPRNADRQKYALPGAAGPDEKWRVHRVSGITDQGALDRLAQAYYLAQGKHELEVEMKTRDLASFGGGNDDPDILDMKFGDTIDVLTRRGQNEESTVTNIETDAQAVGLAIQRFQQMGMSADVAAAYAKAYTDSGFQTLFLVKAMKVQFSQDDGASVTVHGINYVEVRADKILGGSEDLTSQQTNGTPSNVVVPPIP